MFKNPLFVNMILAILFFFAPFFVSLANEETYKLRLNALNLCLKDSQIPCRWVPVLENSYGSPIFNYSAPLSYYFGSLILRLTGHLPTTIKILFSISLVGAFFFMLMVAAKLLDRSKVYLLTTLYTLISFLIMLLSKESLSFAWGLMFFPLIVFNLRLLWQKKTIRNFLFLSISLAVLILSSNFSLIVIGLLIVAISWQYLKFKDFTLLMVSLSSIILAFLLSAFYIFPAILERNLVHSISPDSPLRFLPKSVMEEPKIAADLPYRILTGDSDISNFKQGTNWLKFEANTKTHTIIRLSQHYFPDWRIFIDGKETQPEYKNNSLGLMTTILGDGNHIVEARLYDTPIRLIANVITMFSSAFALFLFFIHFPKVRSWIGYYRKRIN